MRHPSTLLSALFLVSLLPASARAWPLNGVPLTTAPNEQFLPVIVSDGSGGAIVAWQDFRNGADWDVYVQRVDADGLVLWTPNGVAICTATDDQTQVRIVSDGAGGAIVSWEDERGTESDIYAQRVDATGLAQWLPVNGVAICAARDYQHYPTIASDGSGGAIVTWQDYRSTTNHDIFVQRVDISGTVQWTPDGVHVCIEPSDQLLPVIIADASAGAIVAWIDYRSSPDIEVYAQRIDATGGMLWTGNGVGICPAGFGQGQPKLVTDGSGGAIVTWDDHRNGTEEIYARRIDASGAVQWSADGTFIGAGPDGLYTSISDGSGGAMIAWPSYTIATGTDVRAQWVDATGTVQWTPGGVPVCTTANAQNDPTIAPDGSGGAIVAWYDYRNLTNVDVYAQRLDVAGAPQWHPEGVAVCSAVDGQGGQTILSDGAGGAIVAWEDYRSGFNTDIYALRIGPRGYPTSVRTTPPFVAMSLSPNFPNPFSGETSMDLDLVAEAEVGVVVYDAAGHRVRSIGRSGMSAGPHQMRFDGRDDIGRPLPSGVYFYRVTAAGASVTHKMVIAR